MENALVSARIPQVKKDHATKALASIGSTASGLINCAYDYAIANKQLSAITPRRELAKDDFNRFVEGSTLDIAWTEDAGSDYKTLLKQWRLKNYESLA